MMLGLSHEQLQELLNRSPRFQSHGRIESAKGILTASLHAELGELCEIHTPHAAPILCEAIGFHDRYTHIMPFSKCGRVRPGMEVRGLGKSLRVPVGHQLLGRVINGLGQPIDGKGPIRGAQQSSLSSKSPPSMARNRISKKLITGIRVLDALMTFGLGQRMALLAGSGVGKSTLLGDIARGSSADVNVVALIGERGREVRPFIDDCLGEEGLKKSVVVVATADEEPLMRVRAATTAMANAKHFRSTGKDVLFLLDSISRIANSQRELGLLIGEPPSLRGYTPSVFKLMAELLEQMGNSDKGSISGVVTVLVEGSDFDEPICDTVRSIVDGHVVLDRNLAEHGHYPAVSVSQSLSRIFRDITDESHRNAASKIRDTLATYEEVEDLLRVGAYQIGTSSRIDKAIHLKPAIDEFVQQDVNDRSSFANTIQKLNSISSQWGDRR